MIRRPSYSLFEARAKFCEVQAGHIFRQIVHPINYFDTSLDIVCRDIKDENIIFSSDLSVKLIDFASAVMLRPRQHGHRQPIYFDQVYWTMNFGSPKILKGMSYRAEPAEMWSLGVFFFTILTGEIPFPGPYSAAASPGCPRHKVEGKASGECLEIFGGILMRNL